MGYREGGTVSEIVNVHLLNGVTRIYRSVTHVITEGCFIVKSEGSGQREWQRAFPLVNIRSMSWKLRTDYSSNDEEDTDDNA